MRYHEIYEEISAPFDPSVLTGIDLTSGDKFLASLRRVPKEQLAALQELWDRLRHETDKRPANALELYHGAPDAAAAGIVQDGFRLTTGQRGGFLGSVHEVDNLGVFLTDSKKIANYFGSNRSKYGHDYKMFTCWIDPSKILDFSKPSPRLRKIGSKILKDWDGKNRTKIPSGEWWWLLDKPEFVETIKSEGFTGVKFKEDIAIRRSAGQGNTYFVFDPATIVIKGKNGVETIGSFFEWIKDHSAKKSLGEGVAEVCGRCWIGPNKEILPVIESHSEMVKDEAATFGLDQKKILALIDWWEENTGEYNYDYIIALAERNGWVRISHDSFNSPLVASGKDLRTVQKAVRLLIDKGEHVPSISLEIEHIGTIDGEVHIEQLFYSLENDEQVDYFLRKSSIPCFSKPHRFPVDLPADHIDECAEVLDESRMGSAIRLQDIPPQYKKLPVLGRGTTTIALDNGKNVILITRDTMKVEWLRNIDMATMLDQFDSDSHIRGMHELPVYIVQVPKLFKLDLANKRLANKAVREFNNLHASLGYRHNDETLRKMAHHFTQDEDHILAPLFSFLSNYEPSQFDYDLGIRNFMQDADGKLVVSDPVVASEIMELINNHKFGCGRNRR